MSWAEHLARLERERGEKFDPAELHSQFQPYYRTGTRIKVQDTRFPDEEPRTGRVGMTLGWRPAFLLMARSNSTSSSDVLRASDKIIAVQYGRTWRNP